MFKHFRGDLMGGLTAGIVALPLALAFGASSGLGPSAGIYGAIFISFFGALFGGTSTQISGPTAPMTAVSMVVIAHIIAINNGNVGQALPYILTVFLLAGLFQIVLGLLGLGKYIRYIPYPVVSGFMTAIGVIILITQLLPAVGYYAQEDAAYVNTFFDEAKGMILEKTLEDVVGDDVLVLEDFQEALSKGQIISKDDIVEESRTLAKKEAAGVLGTLKVLPQALRNLNWLELLLALGTIIIIYGFKKITTALPSTLVALVVMTSIALGFSLDYRPIEQIPDGFPVPNLEIVTGFRLSAIVPYIFTALTLALLGAIDSLLTSVVADNMTKTKHKPNKELVGQGIGNSIAAIFGGIPGAGATIRTVVNINSGGKTRLSGMIAGIILLIILLGLGPIASKIPAAVLAGILITVGIGVMDYKGLKAIPNLPKDVKIGPIKLSSEVIIMLVVLGLSTFWNLVYAVGIGLVIASLLFMKKIGDLTASQSSVLNMGSLDGSEQQDSSTGIPLQLKEKVFVKQVQGPIFFGSVAEIQKLADQVPGHAKHLILIMERVSYIDQSGLYALEDIVFEKRKQGAEVHLLGLQQQPRYLMEHIDIIPDLIPETDIHEQMGDCLNQIMILEQVKEA